MDEVDGGWGAIQVARGEHILPEEFVGGLREDMGGGGTVVGDWHCVRYPALADGGERRDTTLALGRIGS